MSVFTEVDGGVILNVRAQPRSSRPGLDSVIADAVKVRVKSAPVDGRANKEIIEVVADALGLAKSRVAFKSGETSKTKRLMLSGVTVSQLQQILSKI
ncbi:MAG: DUF167 domain-containing protein [Kiritimatiellae bacterium]|nr:DUF167 domain-containing protein [Kiritimatiellia bacterium]